MLSTLDKYKERYLLLLPALLLFVVFRYVPMAGIVLAWKQFNVTLGLFASPWAGWKYFERLFAAPDFFRVLRNTVFINGVGPTGGRGTWYRNPNWGPISIGANTSDEVLIKIMQILEDQFSDAELYARVFYGGEQGETWQIDENGYHVAIPGTGAAKDGASGALLGVRMISPAHIVPPVDKVYIAPNRHALQSWIESHQTSGPGIGFRPDWNEDERALAGNLKTIEQEFAWKGITGAIDIAASWDGYVEDMMKAGLEQLLESLANKGM